MGWEGGWCFGHYVSLPDIIVCFPKVMLHLLHHPGKLVRGYWPKTEDGIFRVTAPTSEVFIVFWIWTLKFSLIILTSVIIGLW